MSIDYCTWSVVFDGGYGITPDSILRERGFESGGILHVEPFKILGYVESNADLSNMEAFNIIMLSSEEALLMALTIDTGATLNHNGELVLTPLSKDLV
jgi:hypothetical protein